MRQYVVDASELAVLVDELEDRVERLEPLILRKEVDRKLWQLRREQIRNTALRFKLQTTVQRYNTYQQYWQRICRDIENGTYYRDVSRAAARFGEAALTAMGRKRQKMFEKGMERRQERDALRKSSEPGTGGTGQPARIACRPSSNPAGPGDTPTAVRPPKPPANQPLLELEDLADLAPLAEELISAIDRPQSGERRRPPLAVVPPPTGCGPPAVPPLPHQPLPAVAPVVPPLRPASKKPPAPDATRTVASRAATTGIPRGLLALSIPSGDGSRHESARPPSAASQPAAPQPAVPRPSPAPEPPARRPGPPRSPPEPPAVHPESPPCAIVGAVRVAEPVRPSAAAAGRARVQASTTDDLPDGRVRQIYGAYVEAKRRCHESTAGITFERLSANLRRTAAEIQAKHPGRQIDFEVIVKNGAAVLRPVVRR